MRININQWAVGQGGFHSGIFNTNCSISGSQEKFVYIFDFGTHSTTSSMKRKQILNRELDKFLEIYGDDYCKVDVLFLSHLDEDHHNGIRDILNDQSKYTIKNLVIPHAELAERLISLAILCHSKKSSISEEQVISEEQIKVMLNPFRYFTEILGENTNIIEYEDSFEDLELDNNYFEVSGGELISIDHVWKLKPYMQRSLDTSQIRKKFFTEVQKQMSNSGVSIGNSEDGTDLESEIINILNHQSKIDIKKLIKILSDSYAKSGKTKSPVTWKNLVSLNLYSGPTGKHPNRSYWDYIDWDYNKLPRYNFEMLGTNRVSKIGWILTGDADLKASDYFSDFIDFFADELWLTRFFSLPHHGSRNNWDINNFNELNYDFVYLIEFGTKNLHHHPSGIIIYNMAVRKFDFFGITENSRDRFGVRIRI